MSAARASAGSEPKIFESVPVQPTDALQDSLQMTHAPEGKGPFICPLTRKRLTGGLLEPFANALKPLLLPISFRSTPEAFPSTEVKED